MFAVFNRDIYLPRMQYARMVESDCLIIRLNVFIYRMIHIYLQLYDPTIVFIIFSHGTTNIGLIYGLLYVYRNRSVQSYRICHFLRKSLFISIALSLNSDCALHHCILPIYRTLDMVSEEVQQQMAISHRVGCGGG